MKPTSKGFDLLDREFIGQCFSLFSKTNTSQCYLRPQTTSKSPTHCRSSTVSSRVFPYKRGDLLEFKNEKLSPTPYRIRRSLFSRWENMVRLVVGRTLFFVSRWLPGWLCFGGACWGWIVFAILSGGLWIVLLRTVWYWFPCWSVSATPVKVYLVFS